MEVTDLGPTQLKNIDRPIRAYSLQVGVPAKPKPTKHAGTGALIGNAVTARGDYPDRSAAPAGVLDLEDCAVGRNP
jgi:hypothetical protein